MNAEFIKETISTLVYLLPLVGLVWKGGKLAERFTHLEAEVKEKTGKFCKDHKDMEERIEEERKSTDMAINTLMNTLTEIQKSLVRVETKLEERK